MEEKNSEQHLFRKFQLWVSIGSLVVYTLITIGGFYASQIVSEARMDERIANLERDQAKHEKERGEQIQRNIQRADDHEQRLIRLEANFSTIQETLSEMKADIKILIRGNARH